MECVFLVNNLTLNMQLAPTIFTKMCLITMCGPVVALVSERSTSCLPLWLQIVNVIRDIRATLSLLEMYECNKVTSKIIFVGFFVFLLTFAATFTFVGHIYDV